MIFLKFENLASLLMILARFHGCDGNQITRLLCRLKSPRQSFSRVVSRP